MRVDPWPWRDGSVVARCAITGMPSGEAPQFGDGFAGVLEEEAEPFGSPPLTGQLKGLHGHVEWVLWRLGQAGY